MEKAAASSTEKKRYHISEKVRCSCAQGLIRHLLTHRSEKGESLLFSAAIPYNSHPRLYDALMTHKQYFNVLSTTDKQLISDCCLSLPEASGHKQIMLLTLSLFPSLYDFFPLLHQAASKQLPLLIVMTYPKDFRKNASQATINQMEAMLQNLQTITHFTSLVENGEALIPAVDEAIDTFAKNPGPCCLLFPEEIMGAFIDFKPQDFQKKLHTLSSFPPKDAAAKALFETLSQAQRPIVILGKGAKACDYKLLSDTLKKWKVPVCETLSGKGCLPFDFPYHAGVLLKKRHSLARKLLLDSDRVLCLGTHLVNYDHTALFVQPKSQFFFYNLYPHHQINDSRYHYFRGDIQALLNTSYSKNFQFEKEGNYLHSVLQSIDEGKREYIQATFESGDTPTIPEVVACINRSVKPYDICIYSSNEYLEESFTYWRSQHHRHFPLIHDIHSPTFTWRKTLGYLLSAKDSKLYLVLQRQDLVLQQSLLQACKTFGYSLNLIIFDSETPSSLKLSNDYLRALGYPVIEVENLDEMEMQLKVYRKKGQAFIACIHTQAFKEKSKATLWQHQIEKRLGLKDSANVSYKSEEQSWHVQFPWDDHNPSIQQRTHSFEES